MSGVYIKGMEMLRQGNYLAVVDNNTPGKTFVTFKKAYDTRKIVGSYEIIPVPDHGRLIDADEQIENWNREENQLLSDGITYLDSHTSDIFADFKNDLEIASTIIPADKEEQT